MDLLSENHHGQTPTAVPSTWDPFFRNGRWGDVRLGCWRVPFYASKCRTDTMAASGPDNGSPTTPPWPSVAPSTFLCGFWTPPYRSLSSSFWKQPQTQCVRSPAVCCRPR
ncbi:hypothetical protein DH86_00001924 [Scytalidium sp. 3C]|nr:hypothetical protein DH86_00001924 [Scytalidium sp. 3C]